MSDCKYCRKTLVPIGNKRKNGKAHGDWNDRNLHKKCWYEILQTGIRKCSSCRYYNIHNESEKLCSNCSKNNKNCKNCKKLSFGYELCFQCRFKKCKICNKHKITNDNYDICYDCKKDSFKKNRKSPIKIDNIELLSSEEE